MSATDNEDAAATYQHPVPTMREFLPEPRYWFQGFAFFAAANFAFWLWLALIDISGQTDSKLEGILGGVGVILGLAGWIAAARGNEKREHERKAAKELAALAEERAARAERHAQLTSYALSVLGHLWLRNQNWQRGQFEEVQGQVGGIKEEMVTVQKLKLLFEEYVGIPRGSVSVTPGTGELETQGHAPTVSVGGIPMMEAFGTVTVETREKELDVLKEIVAVAGTVRFAGGGTFAVGSPTVTRPDSEPGGDTPSTDGGQPSSG